MFEESTARSIVKAVSWRILATLTTAILVFAFTRQLDVAVAVGLLEAVAKMILYIGHERVWNKLGFGRRVLTAAPPPDASTTSRSSQPVGNRGTMMA